MFRQTLTVLVAVIGLGAVLAACASPATTPAGTGGSSSSSDSPASSSPSSEPVEPVGPGVWVSTASSGKTLIPGTPVVITLAGDGIGVNAGCNRMSGPLVDHGDRWEVGELAQTEMGCSQELMDQDAWVAELLLAGPAVTRAGDEITLTAGDVSLTLAERKPAELTGTTWKLTGLISKDAVSSLPLGAEDATLVIRADGHLSLTGLCNVQSATVDLSTWAPEEGESVLSVSGGATTRMFCEGLMEAEEHANSVLSGDVTFAINDQSLTLTNGDGLGLQLVAVIDDGATSGEPPTSDETTEPAVPSEPAAQTVWVATGVEGKTLVPESSIVLTVSDGKINVRAGCNGQGGAFVDEGGRWVVSELGTTLMACDQALMDQDAWVAELLTAGPTVTRDGDEITLTAGDVSLTLAERKPAELVGTTWKLTGLIADDGISSLPVEAEGTTMTISADGSLVLGPLCNGVGGQLDGTPDGSSFTIELGPSTQMFCEGSSDVEGHAHKVLAGEVSYEIDDQTLTVLGTDGNGLQFTAAG